MSMIQTILNVQKLELSPGDILLLHFSKDADRTHMAQAIETIKDHCSKRELGNSVLIVGIQDGKTNLEKIDETEMEKAGWVRKVKVEE